MAELRAAQDGAEMIMVEHQLEEFWDEEQAF
jgi:hypothetical protein